ncbi:sugar phosphate isomerase/epimerase family protein [Micromonospora narathiwatensis]|uniref:Sugar phosphate isomerase/epimerase n=1 Tax=Micromonospora narathiwatensis TaxID=299146 RepID=A0A1A8ZZK3_9ACTN|nr:sugar phosphate isomerase/epimerase family protein [Micromonospora narathiwatensis]SBT49320.1 Sugar phosphate isomerase/epimerase [Micromonospora narathiwatensis]
MNDSTHGMSRRRMLGTIAGAAGAVAAGAAGLAPSPAFAGNGVLVPSGKRGIILYSVRDRISAAPDETGVPYGFERVLARLANIGYKEVEFAGYTQHTSILGRQITPQEIRKVLDDNGLRANGSHASVPSTVNPTTIAQFEQTLDTAEILGMTHIGTGSDPTGSNYKADWDAAADRWNTFGEMAAARGLKLYTHNHDAAYNFLLDSGPLDGQGRPTRSSGVRKLEYFFGLTNPEWVWFEMDIYWAHVAQHRYRSYTDPDGVTQTNVFDPLATVAVRTKRFPLFHAKDGTYNPASTNGYEMVPLGQGDIDYGGFFANMGAKGYHNPMWEQDTAPGGAADPGRSLRFAEISYQHMSSLRG